MPRHDCNLCRRTRPAIWIATAPRIVGYNGTHRQVTKTWMFCLGPRTTATPDSRPAVLDTHCMRGCRVGHRGAIRSASTWETAILAPGDTTHIPFDNTDLRTDTLPMRRRLHKIEAQKCRVDGKCGEQRQAGAQMTGRWLEPMSGTMRSSTDGWDGFVRSSGSRDPNSNQPSLNSPSCT